MWSANTLAFGVVLGEEKQRIRTISEQGRDERITPSRILDVVEPRGEVPGGTPEARRAAARRAAGVAERIRLRAESIDVKVLWEIVCGSRDEIDLSELADLACASADGPARTAVLVALLDDGVHFVRRGESWEVRSAEAVATLERERAQVERRARETAAVFERLSACVGLVEPRSAPVEPLNTEAESRYLHALERLAIEEEGVAEGHRTLALAALKASGLRFDRPHEGAFRLLRRLGHFESDDANLQVLRYRLQTEFDPELLRHATDLAGRGFDRQGRVDLTDLPVISIDGPSTREIDDVLSVDVGATGRSRFGVHISDPSALIPPGDPLDRAALSRAVTHYHPECTLTMLPPVIAEQAASLVEGQDRPALSFLVELDEAGGIADYRLVRSIIRSRARLDYAEADRRIASGEGDFAEMLRELSRAAGRRLAGRVARGAIPLSAPEVEPRVEADGTIHLERIDPGAPSRRAVSEAMILAGEVAARFCAEHRIPAIYRRQQPPSARPELPAAALEDGIVDPVVAFALRRQLKRAEVGLQPAPHSSLGLPAYTQVTSPLRRYQDLATQRQIAAALAQRPPAYDAEAMQRIAATTEQSEADARRAERTQEEYWLLRYLERRTGETITALVLATEPRPVVQLRETLLERPVGALAGVEPGTWVELKIERVNPRAGVLALALPKLA
jgi:exoribonuclease-2